MDATPRIRPWLAAFLVALVAIPAGSEDTRSSGSLPSPWRSGEPLPIAVVDGKARFRTAETYPKRSTLVIVSTLSRKEGPFPVQLAARVASEPQAPKLTADGPRRAPDLKFPPLAPIAPPTRKTAKPARTFHLLVRDGDVASARNYQAVRATLRAVGERVQVYVDEQDLGRVGDPLVADVVSTFDRRVFPVAAKTYGQVRDVDGDGRFTVLLSSWLSRLASGKHSVDGFVRGADLDLELGAPFSNHCDMMYLNAAMEPGPHLRTVIAHEYTHAVTYTRKSFNGPAGERFGLDEEGWLDEALAHLGEDLHHFSRSNLDYRISAYLSRPEAYRLIVEDYYSADLFRSHGNRGGTYLFLRWCADRYGPMLLPALVRSSRRGTDNLEAATGLTFPALYRRWTTALFLSGLDPHYNRGEGFRSLDIRSTIDGWQLAGPRTIEVVPGTPPETWTAAGTSSRYLIVEGSSRGPVEIEVQGPPDAELQVTAIPLPADQARLDLKVTSSVGRDGKVELLARVGESRGNLVQLTAMAWEPLVPAADPHSSPFRKGGLDRPSLAKAFGSATLNPGGQLASRPIPLDGVKPGQGPVVIKLVGIDARGRRVTAWAELSPERAGGAQANRTDHADVPTR